MAIILQLNCRKMKAEQLNEFKHLSDCVLGGR